MRGKVAAYNTQQGHKFAGDARRSADWEIVGDVHSEPQQGDDELDDAKPLKIE